MLTNLFLCNPVEKMNIHLTHFQKINLIKSFKYLSDLLGNQSLSSLQKW
ncbi:hypothetical protein J504_2488 [Acinetobacter baumannii 348935]|nr:hypothetical protein J504_2488 [Acinetobacter baumannii 348935]